MVTVQTPIKAPSLCGGCSPRLLLAILQHLFFNFVAGSPLSVDRAMAVLGGVAGRWRGVGTRLCVPYTVLDLIASECTSDSECLRKALRYWIQRDPLASWRGLIYWLDSSVDDDLVGVADGVRHLAEELTGQCYSAVPLLIGGSIDMIHLLFIYGLGFFGINILVRQISNNFSMHRPPS